MHAFRSGIVDAPQALENWSKSRSGERMGRRVGFPRFKKRGKSVPSVSFVDINHQLSWLHENRHAIRLMLPQSTPDAAVKRRRGETIGVDGGVKHLATLSRPVPGLTDEHGHVANPNVLDGQLRRLRRLDRSIARTEKGSKNRRKLLDRRARLHGRIAKTRALRLHHLSNALAEGSDVIAIEDLNLPGMANRKRRLGQALADASLGELRRQLTYKTADHGTRLVVVDRFYPSSKTCSHCGLAKAKLALWERTYVSDGTGCAMFLDRDVNAARNIAREAERLLEHQDAVAGLRPETRNAEPRPRKTTPAHAGMAAVA
jgi:putative transposase